MALAPGLRAVHVHGDAVDRGHAFEIAKGPDAAHDVFHRQIEIQHPLFVPPQRPVAAALSLRLRLLPQRSEVAGHPPGQPVQRQLQFRVQRFMGFVRPQRELLLRQHIAGVHFPSQLVTAAAPLPMTVQNRPHHGVRPAADGQRRRMEVDRVIQIRLPVRHPPVVTGHQQGFAVLLGQLQQIAFAHPRQLHRHAQALRRLQ